MSSKSPNPNLVHAPGNPVPNSSNKSSKSMAQYFLTSPVYDAPATRIDTSAGIIYGVTVAKEGPARGHDGLIDKIFLLQVVELAAQRPQGVKARFGHPNMCATALGTYLGRFHNYAYQAGRVTADLHLDASAKTTPHGDLFSYVLNMAATNPDMFGASLVFESGAFHQHEAETDGKKTTRRYFRLKELRATDIVDDPAATDGLFSAETLPAQATRWLDQNPELSEIIFSKPENLIEFLNNYLTHTHMNFSDAIKSNFRKIFSLDLPPLEEPLTQTDTEVRQEDPNAQHAFHTALFSRFLSLFPQLGITMSDDGTFTFSNDSETHILQPDEISETLFTAIESLSNELSNAQKQIRSLSDQLAARPTLPKDVTDPQVSVNLHQHDKDEAGKQLLQNIPAELRYRLRHLNKQPTANNP